MSVGQRIAKRALDLLGAATLLTALSPLLGLIALWVHLDSPGPALFRQTRVGRNGCRFTCYKFRTMQVDAPDVRNPDGSTYSADDDPRVTRVGRFLRRTSVDELPQLFNVLIGQMSLVGPRPELPDQAARYTQQETKRLAVKPGITGWSAIHGRNTLPWSVRRTLDIEYVETYSFWLDLHILARTIPVVLRGSDVYASDHARE